MDERDFFDESETRKPANLSCMHCRQSDTYEIRWLVRTKKKALRGDADERDRAKFAKAQSYMTRLDDVMQCKNPRCRKRFDITGVQSVSLHSLSFVYPGIMRCPALRGPYSRRGSWARVIRRGVHSRDRKLRAG